jgi:hypothetical protein
MLHDQRRDGRGGDETRREERRGEDKRGEERTREEGRYAEREERAAGETHQTGTSERRGQ